MLLMLSKRSCSPFASVSNAPKITKNKKILCPPQSKGGKKMQNAKSRNTWKLVTNQPNINELWTPFTLSNR
jgi:hypothetical protein